LKKYILIEEDKLNRNKKERKTIDSWRLLYKNKFVPFVTPKNLDRVIAFSTWHRYVHALHPEYSFKRAVEDACNTCEKLLIALKDPNLPEEQRAVMEACLEEHKANALESRKAYHTAISEWGNKILADGRLGDDSKFQAALHNLPEFVDDAIDDA
jgi:hypothetical protein